MQKFCTTFSCSGAGSHCLVRLNHTRCFALVTKTATDGIFLFSTKESLEWLGAFKLSYANLLVSSFGNTVGSPKIPLPLKNSDRYNDFYNQNAAKIV